MSDINKINDENLDVVNGGAGKTPGGYPIDNKGNVHFTGKDGVTVVINAADWKWLLTQYKGDIGDPEYYLSTVPAHDINIILDDHHAGRR